MTDPDAGHRQVRAFISYAKEDPEHGLAVRNLWTFLRRSGIDARIDLPDEIGRLDWPVWMHQQIETADYILVVASTAYRRYAEQDVGEGPGRGVHFEAALLRELLYRNRSEWLPRILPVILPDEGTDGIPAFLTPASTSVYRVREFTVPGAEKLLRTLTGSNRYPEPPVAPHPPDLPGEDTTRVQVPDKGLAVILLGASPFDIALRRLRGDQEFLAIQRAVRPGALQVSAGRLCVPTDIGTVLRNEPDIVHVCGSYRSDDRTLVLSDPTAAPWIISVDSLARRMGLDREYGAPRLRALVLSVDSGAEFAEEFTDAADSVIAWRGEIPPACAIAFAATFYAQLARDPRQRIPPAVRLAARDIAETIEPNTAFADRLVLFSR